jgi:hypothetical protein
MNIINKSHDFSDLSLRAHLFYNKPHIRVTAEVVEVSIPVMFICIICAFES